jgi:spore coat polysaccharide biosynthesis protein SpsF
MNKVKNQVIIQARMGSTRLPGKVLLELNSKPVLEYVVRRSQAAASVGRVVVATTDQPGDDPIESFCVDNSICLVRGDSDNVLSRYLKAAELFPCDNIVRITADCPLTDPGILDGMLAVHQVASADYTANLISPTFPVGFDAEIVKTEVLKKVGKLAELKSHLEHVTLYIRENLSEFVTCNYELGKRLPEYRLTLDRQQDYDALQALFEFIPDNDFLFSFYEVVEILRQHPEIGKINAGIDRYEGAKKSARSENRKLAWE